MSDNGTAGSPLSMPGRVVCVTVGSRAVTPSRRESGGDVPGSGVASITTSVMFGKSGAFVPNIEFQGSSGDVTTRCDGEGGSSDEELSMRALCATFCLCHSSMHISDALAG